MKILENVETYKVGEPLFEGVRVIMSYLGEQYSPQYIQGISGAAFRVATGCPSRPTCCKKMWTTELLTLLGYEYIEYTSADTENMIDAIKKQIDIDRPVLVWNAMTNLEWDVVCGYDEEKRNFYGRGSYVGLDNKEYHNEPWDRAVKTDIAFGAIVIGEKTGDFDRNKAEISALKDAVVHARTVKDSPEDGGWYSYEGIQALREWAKAFSNKGKERGAADSYCFQVYHSTHGTAAGFLKEIACNYPGESEELLLKAADLMEEESLAFTSCNPYLWWDTPWEADEERSKKVAPLLNKTADLYEKAIECIEEALKTIA